MYEIAPSGCWEWTGTKDAKGYGRVGRGLAAYRFVYEKHRGPIPKGMELDHLCRNRACVNPEHLEVVTGAENKRRMARPDPTKCGKGLHDWTPENIRPQPRGGRCRLCTNASQRARHASPEGRAADAARARDYRRRQKEAQRSSAVV